MSYPTKSPNTAGSGQVVYGKNTTSGDSKYVQTGVSNAGMPSGTSAPKAK